MLAYLGINPKDMEKGSFLKADNLNEHEISGEIVDCDISTLKPFFDNNAWLMVRNAGR